MLKSLVKQSLNQPFSFKIGMKKIYKFLVMFEIISKPPIIKLNPPHQWTIHNFRNKYLNPQSIVRLLVLLPWILGPFRGPHNLWTGNGPSERPGKKSNTGILLDNHPKWLYKSHWELFKFIWKCLLQSKLNIMCCFRWILPKNIIKSNSVMY